MIPGSYTPAERRAYRATLRETHLIETHVEVLNMNEQVVGRLRHKMLDGQVDVDLSADVVRTVSLTLLDPAGVVRMDADDPDGAALFADRILKVTQVVKGDRLVDGFEVPVFTGPVRAFARSGATITVEAHDMGALGQGVAWAPREWARGARKVDVLRDILTDMLGYRRVVIPSRDSRLGKDVYIGRGQQPWKVAKRLARSMSCQLLVDGDGRVVVRPIPQRASVTFNDGDRGNLLADPKVTPDWSRVRNAVIVKGARPEGAKKGVKAEAVAPKSHPLSPTRLGLNGAGLYLPEIIEDDSIRCPRDADRLARTTLKDLLREEVRVELESLPMYHVEPGDLALVDTATYDREFRVKAFSMPLTGAGPMTLGYTRRVTPVRRSR